MIILENQVCSQALSEKLRRLGVPQNSYFWWSKAMDNENWRIENSQFFKIDKRRDISAFTVAELGELLPNLSISSKNNGVWTAENLGNRCWFEDGGNYPDNQPYGEANTEADARAKMLVYLLENNLLKI